MAGQHLNVFSLAEIAQITNVLLKLPDAFNSRGSARAYTNGFESTSIIYPFIKSQVIGRIEKILDTPINLTVGMMLKEFKPWLIHSDYKKNDTSPSLAILIPLHTEEIDTHTVMFNEHCVDDFSNFLQKNPKIENNACYLYKTLMSHETEDRLEHVSLFQSFKWHVGSVIYWDRKLLHSSDNFLAKGITEKRALVLFCHND